MTSFVSFARRQNHDATTDSICTRCYQTVASSDNAIDLAAAEAAHLCDPTGEANPHEQYAALQRGTF
jgi:hypothetical protein